ncbi:MAG: polyribonucleotide nucleotidyltransferase [Kofleriaceae bacterium]|jgi:polyribonucleotide nucleotidyltransferase|nr:polyribonucleotide nucleotidyltransferase [Kofleriaceae bacterium]MBP6840577.1 polyribonucleotide nucleotidyltransferase [Kofleriaceae bacterium]MBP9207601.1 polyribonucleotide nucleotidyltransferase [Kofleriaceae bacterium]
MPYVKETALVGGKEITIETGKWAKLAGGAVVVTCGDTKVLVTACGSAQPREIDFMPLTCEYQEKFYSSGKIPGSFFRREGRQTTDEILVCRLMDRPIRPLFPKGWFIDTQIIANVVSFDKNNPADVLAMTGASAALHISDLVFDGPIAGVRVGRIDGQFVANPTFAERAQSDLDIIVAASRDAITMVEGEMAELGEAVIIDALMFAHQACQSLIDLQERLRKAVGKDKRAFTPPVADEGMAAAVKTLVADKLAAAMVIKEKKARYGEVAAIRAMLMTELGGEGKPYQGRVKELDAAFGKVQKKWARGNTLATRSRIDGRKPDEIRPITVETGVLPRAHGSALFTRGETQALVAVTLGTKYDEQKLDTLRGDVKRTFYMHYNFPPFSTGETKPLRGQSRREVGHGFLAERSVARIVPEYEDFSYTIRVVSDILESNGSSSMASVCGGSLALMDAGVPTKAPVAGIAMGLMKEGADYVILSDILGDEDHLGDMDFKVTGTRRGVCALQMDIKVDGLTRQILEEALDQAKRGRLHILEKMDLGIAAPRDEVSQYAPRIVTVQIKPDKVRDIIGPGGKTIRAIQEQTGAQIDINDAGIVSIASADSRSIEQAQQLISGLTMEPEVGCFYNGIVKKIVEIGAFVEIMPGTDGLLHISEVANERIRAVEDVLSEGDEVVVKCIKVDRDGKIRLSRKNALDEKPPAEEIHNFVL